MRRWVSHNVACYCSFDVSPVAVLGIGDLVAKWLEVCNQLSALRFDRCDYAAVKFLTLFNDGMFL